MRYVPWLVGYALLLAVIIAAIPLRLRFREWRRLRTGETWEVPLARNGTVIATVSVVARTQPEAEDLAERWLLANIYPLRTRKAKKQRGPDDKYGRVPVSTTFFDDDNAVVTATGTTEGQS